MNSFTTLNTQPLEAIVRDDNRLDISANENLENVAAHQMMHKLLQFPMLDIDDNTSVDEANLILNKTLRRASFVVNNQGQTIGMISIARLGSRYVLSVAEQRGCARADLSVTDVMIPVKDLLQISLKQVLQNNLESVIKTMEKTGAEFLIVVDEQVRQQVGYFDLIELAKFYGKPLNMVKPANNFSDIVGSVLHHNNL